MCGGVRYNSIRVYSPNPQAQLPILMKDGNVSLLLWGRRKEQEGNLPLGGWARLDSISTGKWEYVQPTPVKITVDAFMEKDYNKDSHWFDLEEGQFIQGLVAHYNGERRIYVVTVEPDQLKSQIHDRWPRTIEV